MALGFPIVDAHVHLWDLERIRYPWLTPPFADDGPNGSVEPIARTYLLDDYLADAGAWEIGKLVHVDAGAVPEAALDETRWLQAMANERGRPDAIVAYAPLNDPEVERLLEAHAAHPNVRGIRQILNWHVDPRKTYSAHDLLQDPAFERGYARLATHDLSFDCQIYPSQMRAAAALASRHPHTPMILNHAGMPTDRDAPGLEQWAEGMARLAEQPNVSVKISGFGLVERNWSIASIRPFVLRTIELFGVERCMFASDFPTDRLFSDFDTVLGAYDHITADFSAHERRQLFAANAERIYRI